MMRKREVRNLRVRLRHVALNAVVTRTDVSPRFFVGSARLWLMASETGTLARFVRVLAVGFMGSMTGQARQCPGLLIASAEMQLFHMSDDRHGCRLRTEAIVEPDRL